MKFPLYIIYVFVLFGCVGNDAVAPPSDSGNTLVGGWTEQPLTWDTALSDLELLKTLVRESHPSWTLKTVQKVESQVVAGFQVRLTMTYSDQEGEKSLRATYFHDIDGKIELAELEAPLTNQGEIR